MRRLAAMFLCAAALSGCASLKDNTASGEDLDPFVLQIDSGRMAVFVDRIGMAAELVETSTGAEETDLVRAAHSVREAAIAFLAAKEQACAAGKFVAQSCARVRVPRWLNEAPNKPVSGAEVRRRIDEVQTMTGPLVDAACDAGKAKSGDGLFCSVE
jgi:hypothetical protein